MSADSFRGRDLLDVESLSAEEIRHILDAVPSFKEVSERDIKKVPTLRGKTVVNLFFEPSTRTRTSFEIAGKRLSADVVNVSVATSSVSKGESLRDMADNLAAMHADVLVVRHQVAGAPHFLARSMSQPVINAGDGAHEHPTQALLDVFTLQEKLGSLNDRSALIVGDIASSRVARSNIHAMRKLGMRVCVCGPRTMLPVGLDRLGVEATSDFDEAIRSADAVMMLRVQRERHSDVLFPSLAEYAERYCLTTQRLRRARDGVVVMHPGPINRGIEIAPEVADGLTSVILQQVTNGVAVRMALLYLILGGG
ncbi:MAG: aspartate carbamoyltransferase catalytic subunit [Candidatus Tectomicrobia bacterium]|nr:aspartate carbamoyltransferase catalytic subunit [Candidatus Tectomicrobia bacterium]